MAPWNRHIPALVVVVIALTGWTAPSPAADEPVREYLDGTTAATITVAREPLIFARERTDLAVNARDYISLAPIEVNRAGAHTYYWFGYVWSTIDKRDDDPILKPGDELVLMADGRPIPLRREARPPRQLGVAEPPMPSPVRSAVPLLFSVDPEIVSFVGAAADLTLHLIRDGGDEPFALWRDARNELRGFLSYLNLGRH